MPFPMEPSCSGREYNTETCGFLQACKQTDDSPGKFCFWHSVGLINQKAQLAPNIATSFLKAKAFP